MAGEWTDSDVKQFAAAFVAQSRTQLAAIAREHYRREGCGIIAITVRGAQPGATPDLRRIQIGYRTAAEYQHRTAPLLATPSRCQVEETIGRIQTYNPDAEVPVAVVCGPTFLTLSFLMSLDKRRNEAVH